jgi:DUF4097 and DUF4098 domain-containing protein YvlB
MGVVVMTKWVAILAVLVSAEAVAWGCKYESKLDQSLSVSGSESLAISVNAGDLEITGVAGSGEVAIRGTVCASNKEWLDEVRIETISGQRAEISVVSPDIGNGWSIWGNKYAYVDLVLEVPENLALDLRDSSGDIEISAVGAVAIQDSSGDITVSNAGGAVEIKDTSGDIRVRDLESDLTVSDSSGDIRGTRIAGKVLVTSDSSGDIRFSGVGQDVMVERDSSGDIVVNGVGGDFTVLRDGSGDIWSEDVAGETTVPRHKD